MTFHTGSDLSRLLVEVSNAVETALGAESSDAPLTAAFTRLTAATDDVLRALAAREATATMDAFDEAYARARMTGWAD